MGEEERLGLSPTCVFQGTGGITKPLRDGEGRASRVQLAEQMCQRELVSHAETL